MWQNPVLAPSLLCLGLPPPPPAARLGWEPRATWLFAVGVLHWQVSTRFAPMSPENRRDAEIVDHFRQAGVPEQQMIYLQDTVATRQRIEEQMTALLSRANAADMLVFYYCGHGYRRKDASETFFAPHDAGVDGVELWSVDRILDTIEQSFCGSRALLVADCCYSGGLAEAASRRRGRVSYAVLSSSIATERSTGRWTFTESVLDGLRGMAFVDLDGDGIVTLDELAHHSERDMVIAEGQAASFETTGRFSLRTALASADLKTDERVGERVEVDWRGKPHRVRIIDVDGDQLRIHFIGWDDKDDQWVDQKLTRQYRLAESEVGDKVEVEWNGQWYPAGVLEVEDGVHRVRFKGFTKAWDEWVSPKRVRTPEESVQA